MKKVISYILTLASTASFAVAGTTISGTAIRNAAGLTGGQTGVFVISTDGSSFADFSLSAGDATSSGFYGSSFSVLGDKPVTSGFGSVSIASGLTVTYTGGISSGDSFGIVVWDSATAVVGSNYSYWTDPSWVLPADTGAQIDFDTSGNAGTFLQLSSEATGTGSIVPEPSTYALLGGLLALGCVTLRRRRA